MLLSSLPITDPILIVALAMLIFLSAPLLFERLRVPGIIGLIVAGVLVGPNGLNLLARDATIVLLGTVGLLYLMFIAGVDGRRGSWCAAAPHEAARTRRAPALPRDQCRWDHRAGPGDTRPRAVPAHVTGRPAARSPAEARGRGAAGTGR